MKEIKNFKKNKKINLKYEEKEILDNNDNFFRKFIFKIIF